MEQLIIALITAAVSALTFIAYKHPSGYRKIRPYIQNSITAVFFVCLSWNLGVSTGISEVQEFISPENFDEVGAIKDTLLIPFLVLILSYLIVQLYFTILFALPLILDLEDNDID